MEPRGQLWFELERVCRDFREFSGLDEKDGLRTIISVLRNLLGDLEGELERLSTPPAEGQAGAPPA